MAVLLTQAVYNAPYGYDFSSARRRFHGSLKFVAGSYVTGGLLPNWDSATFVLNPLQNAALVNQFPAGYTFPAVFNITNSVLATNVVTITAVNTLVAGQFVTFSGLTNIPALNGLTLQVISTGLSGTAFEVDFTHANVATAAETGQAVVVIGPDTEWIQSNSGSGYVYSYNKAKATIQVFIATPNSGASDQLSELAAGALPAGVVADIIEFEAEYVSQ
jgi:hypothetical protein